MSIQVIKCESCGKMIGWKEPGDYSIDIAILRDWRQCKTCYNVENSIDRYSFCSLECFNKWRRKEKLK